MGDNKAGAVRKTKLKRRRREVARMAARCEAANLDAQKQGAPPADFTREIRKFAESRK